MPAMSPRLLPVLCLALLLALTAAASPLAAQTVNELTVTPAEPFDDEPVHFHLDFTTPSPCYSTAGLVRSGNTFEYSIFSCPVLPPPGPADNQVDLQVGPLAAGVYQLRVVGETGVLASRSFTVRTPNGSCQPSATRLCLGERRFQVEATWEANGQSGAGQTRPLTRDTGTFYFFDADNIELVVKVIEGCALDNHFWVFAGGLTNVRTTLTVTDTAQGTTKTYQNPSGTPFQPIQDTAAFPCE
jgi:hypothetical protein